MRSSRGAFGGVYTPDISSNVSPKVTTIHDGGGTTDDRVVGQCNQIAHTTTMVIATTKVAFFTIVASLEPHSDHAANAMTAKNRVNIVATVRSTSMCSSYLRWLL